MAGKTWNIAPGAVESVGTDVRQSGLVTGAYTGLSLAEARKVLADKVTLCHRLLHPLVRSVRVHGACSGASTGSSAGDVATDFSAAVFQFPQHHRAANRYDVYTLRAGRRHLADLFYGFNMSVAVAVGFIALAGVATEIGVVAQ